MENVTTLGEIVQALKVLFGRLAKPCRETEGHSHNVRVFYGKDAEQDNILIKFMTTTDLMVELKLDMKKLVREGRPYLYRMMEELTSMIDVSLERRQQKTRSIITLNGADNGN